MELNMIMQLQYLWLAEIMDIKNSQICRLLIFFVHDRIKYIMAAKKSM